jgi:hypothetical protein
MRSNRSFYLLYQASIRRIRRANAKKRELRIIRSTRPRDKHRRPRFNAIDNFYFKNHELTISLKGDFALLENPELVISLINQFATIENERHIRKKVLIDISKITALDIGAIGLLLSVVNSLTKKNIPIVGNLPNDESCRDLFIRSGFLSHMQDMQGKPFNRKGLSLLIERGFDKTSNKRVGDEIKKAVNYLTGISQSYRPVYSMVQEMCANSIEHANSDKRKKNWLFAVYYDVDKVIFTMTDIGEGILSTLKKKAVQLFQDAISFKDDVLTLDGAFDKKYQSSTLDANRNKGLPKIKEINSEQYVENLKVITNRVFLDFSNPKNSRKLDHKLKGTFYYWELTKKSIERWQTRNI